MILLGYILVLMIAVLALAWLGTGVVILVIMLRVHFQRRHIIRAAEARRQETVG